MIHRLTGITFATIVILAACTAPSVAQTAALGPVRFQAHDVADIQAGYAVEVADFNDDGLLDIVANSTATPGLVWRENPSWTPHVIASELTAVVNKAVADLDGDGVPEVAIQSAFAMQAANSRGENWIARSGGDPKGEWTLERIDEWPTSHHVVFADLDGDGALELVNAPLIGPESLGPTYDHDRASIFWYAQEGWTRGILADANIPGIIHRVRRIRWEPEMRDELLVASFEGIALYRASGTGAAMTFEKHLLSPGHVEAAPRLGASDVGAGKSNGEWILASVEPWHGNEVVVYTESRGAWQRRVIFDGIARGHEVAVADLNGDGRSDIIANDNARPSEDDPRHPQGGVHVFFSPDDPATGEWTYSRIERELLMNGCVTGDMNNDGRIDIVCTGAGNKTRWYENLGS